MKKTKLKMMTMLLTAAMISILSAGCGGDDEEDAANDVEYVAEDACSDCEARESLCVGDATGGCEDIEPEICEEVVGCEARIYEEQDYVMCFNRELLDCADQRFKKTCELIRGCEWVD